MYGNKWNNLIRLHLDDNDDSREVTTNKMSEWYVFKEDVVNFAPDKAGAYELSCKGAIVFIGSSRSSIKDSLQKHIGLKKFGEVTHFRFCKTSPNKTGELEAKLCQDFNNKHRKLPRLNRTVTFHKKSDIDDMLL